MRSERAEMSEQALCNCMEMICVDDGGVRAGYVKGKHQNINCKVQRCREEFLTAWVSALHGDSTRCFSESMHHVASKPYKLNRSWYLQEFASSLASAT